MTIIWAPSSEFVSSSIPSWQTLTAHAQPFRGARDLAFCLKVPLDSLLVWASSGGSGETARMRRLAWTFAAHIGDKYQIRLTRSIWSDPCRRSHSAGHGLSTCLRHKQRIIYRLFFSFLTYVDLIHWYSVVGFKAHQSLCCIVWYLPTQNKAYLIPATSWENLFLPYVNNKGTDQPVQPCSLISTFVVCYVDNIIPTLAKYKITRLWLVSVAEQTSLSLTWSQTPNTGFLVTRLILSFKGSQVRCSGLQSLIWDLHQSPIYIT